MRPGDYCKPREEDRCDCDSRGTIPNTQCDANTLQCQCKVNIYYARDILNFIGMQLDMIISTEIEKIFFLFLHDKIV